MLSCMSHFSHHSTITAKLLFSKAWPYGDLSCLTNTQSSIIKSILMLWFSVDTKSLTPNKNDAGPFTLSWGQLTCRSNASKGCHQCVPSVLCYFNTLLSNKLWKCINQHITVCSNLRTICLSQASFTHCHQDSGRAVTLDDCGS